MHDEALTLAGETQGTGPGMLILHGLFGSGRNWSAVARALVPRYTVTTLDLRNHGASPHHAHMDFPAMASDVLAAADRLGHERFSLVGHSLGGKVAMTLASRAAARLTNLVIVDVAPVTYPDRYRDLIAALEAAPRDPGLSRADVDRALAAAIPDRALRLFLLQSYRRDDTGWRWRFNLEGIRANLPSLMGFPAFEPVTLDAPVTLIAGGTRGMVPDESGRAAFCERFPGAGITTLEHLGHWPHAEDRDAFLTALEAALADS